MENSIDQLNLSAAYGEDQSVELSDPLNNSSNVSVEPTVEEKSPKTSPKKKKRKSKSGYRRTPKKIGKTVANGIEVKSEIEAENGEAVKEEDVNAEDDAEYEVKSIVDDKKEGKITLYRVRWKGYTAKHDSWLPREDLGCFKILKKYLKLKKQEQKDIYAVQEILDCRRVSGSTYYLVSWQGFSDSENTWQSVETLNCPKLIKEYRDRTEEALIKAEQLKLAAKEKAKNRNNEFEVEMIIDHKIRKGILSYLVRWLGWDAKDDTWIPEDQLNCPDLVKAYDNKEAKKQKMKKKKRDYSDSEDEYSVGKKSKKEFFLVDRILNCRITKHGKFDFFVSWKGYGFEDNSWVPEEDLNSSELVDEFFGKNKIKPSIQRKINGTTKETNVISTFKRLPFERKTQNSGGIRPGTIKGT
ncbi:unnamed protein product, partial [Diamesa serratosioi]